MRVAEHASKPVFWVLAVGIIAFLAATIASATQKSRNPGSLVESGAPLLDGEKNNETTVKQPGSSRLPVRPYLTAWLAPHITSRTRQIAAMVVYTTIFGLQLLEGNWVLVTGFRWIQNYVHLWRSLRLETPYWIYALHAISFLVLLLMVLG